MACTLRRLWELTGGELLGDADQVIEAARPIHEAGELDVTFLDNAQNFSLLETCKAAAIIVPNNVALPGRNLVRVVDTYAAFVSIAKFLHKQVESPDIGVHPQAFVHPTARLGKDVRIQPFATIAAKCVVGDRCTIHTGVAIGPECVLGNDVTLHPHVVLYPQSIIGDRVTIHANSVIGADGFGYRFHDGKHDKVPQLGRVEIGDDVEIGANTTIDRGTFTATRIGAGTKIDNLVMIAHNCQIGRHNIIVSQAGLAGSSSTGDYVIIAGQVGVVDHVHIGDRSVIGGQAAVTKDVPPDSRMLGSPATPERDQKRILMSLLHLPEFRKELRLLHERLDKAA